MFRILVEIRALCSGFWWNSSFVFRAIGGISRFALGPRLENLPRIAFSIFKFAENLSSWGPPHDPAQPAHPAYAAKSPQPAQQAQPSQLSKPSPVQLAQPGDYFVRMRNGWNLGASAALNPKRRWFGWTPAMSGRGWEKEKRNRI